MHIARICSARTYRARTYRATTYRAGIYAALAAALLSGCADSPLQPTLATDAPSFSREGGFDVVVVRDVAKPASTPGAVAGNLVDALARVRAGGTIRVHPGTYGIEALVIDKPVTIEGVGATRPVLQILPPVPGSAHSAIEISAVTGGAVTLRGLVIDNRSAPNTWAVAVLGEAEQVDVLDTDFVLGAPPAGGLLLSSARAARVQNSTFTGGRSAVAASRTASLQVEGSRFQGQSLYSVRFVSASGSVTGSRFEGCGSGQCVGVYNAGTQVEIADNHFSDATLEGDPYFHNLIEVGYSAAGTVRDNVFDGCGYGQCFTAFRGGVATVAGNRFTTHAAHRTRMVIVANGGDVTIRDNVITGVGATGGDRERPGGYGVHLGAIWAEFGGRATVHNTTVTNAHAAFVAWEGGEITRGSDNRADQVYAGVQTAEGGRVSLHRSDFHSYQVGADVAWNGGRADLSCNWWAAGAPPRTAGDASLVSYDPWAAQPIAGKAEATCS